MTKINKQAPWRKATGIRTGRGDVKQRLTIAVRFEDPTFAAIQQRAEKDNTSFAEQVRRLVTVGLASEEASARVPLEGDPEHLEAKKNLTRTSETGKAD